MKLDSLIKDLVKNRRLGTVAAYVYTIEFQKRGLPHAHIIIILAPGSVPQTTDDIDSLVTAEIPDEHEEPELHRIVTRCMLHGPCHPGSMCWKDDGCSKGFPKPFQATTTFADNAYPNYRRRDNGRVFIKGRSVFNNGHVVPYNKYLSLRYDCHINVEIPYGITALKYLFKYITKGVDRSHMSMSDGDETKKFINGRYIGPSEGLFFYFLFCIFSTVSLHNNNHSWLLTSGYYIDSCLETIPVPYKRSIPSDPKTCTPPPQQQPGLFQKSR
jgi:hypothetical protein